MKINFFPKARAAACKTFLNFYQIFPAARQDSLAIVRRFTRRFDRQMFGSIESVVGKESRKVPKNKLAGKPIICASACVDSSRGGGWKYNGGVKELNLLVRLCRERGYEAYIVTWDGSYVPWLLHHEKHISINDFKALKASGTPLRCVTSWAIAKAFIDIAEEIYFWDMELAYSDSAHFPTVRKLYREKIVNVAAISRTIQAWHMAYFGRTPIVIPNLVDEQLWKRIEGVRKDWVIGYMHEGPHTDEFINEIATSLKLQNLPFELKRASGDEYQILSDMSECTFFLSMNLGKDQLWGEGCPRTILEALWAGCIPIAFDVIGNRETLVDGFNGFVLRDKTAAAMARTLSELIRNSELVNQTRINSQRLLHNVHTFKSRWEAVRQFLMLPE